MNAEEAKDRFDMYTKPYGAYVNPEIIQWHPDNLAQARMSNDDGGDNRTVLPERYNALYANPQFDPQALYGMKILGSYIGSDAFIKSQLLQLARQWQYAKDKLIAFPVAQQRYVLFKFCFCTKPVHILRTVSCKLTYDLMNQFVSFQKEILKSLFLQDVDDEFLDLLSLPIEEGGIGFLNSRDIHSIAHIASFFGFADHREALLHIVDGTVDDPMVVRFINSSFAYDILRTQVVLKS